MIITIDGPAGAGKSTVAALLAQKLGLPYLDTGAMYRAVTLSALDRQVPLDNPVALTEVAHTCSIDFSCAEGKTRIVLDGQDITGRIRDQKVTESAHHIANVPGIRTSLVQQQQRIARSLGSLITEGRDQGSVAFPHARYKFYLDAAPECRARRRFEELRKKGTPVNLQQILDSQTQRDQRDTSRSVGPLVIPPGAIRIDTTDMNIDQVVETLYQYITQKENS
jgi:cytidylate kinase